METLPELPERFKKRFKEDFAPTMIYMAGALFGIFAFVNVPNDLTLVGMVLLFAAYALAYVRMAKNYLEGRYG